MKFYNSLTNEIEDFSPLAGKKVTLYVCGITPYDTTHLGHAFTYAQFDVLTRLLTYSGYEVDYTQNVTDIDDDLLKKAKETNRDWQELGEFWTNQYLLDMKSLNIKKPTHFVKATDSIPTIIKMVSDLVKKRIAYEKKGNVYFNIGRFSNYGQLSNCSEFEMIELSRERGANPDDPFKINQLDFVLWQKAKEGEPSWDSPWGKGRPGWHIECSAMIFDTLSPQIDIHGGGRDLIFPHHESEIAQSESYTGKTPFVKTWMHTSMVLYQGEKMAKSVGNLVMVKDLLKKYSANAIRYLLLANHYRKPWEFEFIKLDNAQKEMSLLEKAAYDISIEMDLIKLLENDLNTPQVLKQLSKKAKAKEKISKEILNLLGFSL